MQYRHALGTLAVLAAAITSSTAFAQSNVTLYGIADAAMGKVAGGKFGMIIGSGLMTNTPSRVGVRGTEDLGGGLKVGFPLGNWRAWLIIRRIAQQQPVQLFHA